MSRYVLKLKSFWGLEVPFLCQNIFFIFGRFIRKYNKLRWAWVTLGDALKNYFLFISSLSMSKQPEKPWGAWLFKLFAFLRHPNVYPSHTPCNLGSFASYRGICRKNFLKVVYLVTLLSRDIKCLRFIPSFLLSLDTKSSQQKVAISRTNLELACLVFWQMENAWFFQQ